MGKYDALMAYAGKTEKPTGKYSALMDYAKNIEKPVEQEVEQQQGDLYGSGGTMEINPKPGALGTFAAHLASGAMLGLPKLIPSVKAGLEESAKDYPTAAATGDIASYITPGAAPSKIFGAAGKAVSKILPKAAPQLVKMGTQAGMAGGAIEGVKGTTEEGNVDVEEGLKKGGVGALSGAGFGAAASGLGSVVTKGFKETGKRLIQALIRPGQKGMKEGFDADYIMNDKEILTAAEGGIEKLQTTLQTRFNNLSNQVKEIQKTTGKEIKVDVPAVYTKVAKKLNASNDFTGMKPELIDALDGLKKNLSNEIEEFDEFTDLATAMKLRTNYGTKVNWVPGISSGGRKAAMGANAEEKVYDAFYKELSAEIKKQAPEEIKKIDAEYSKLIPVLKAANRRVLVETSNLPIGLMETVGGAGVGATAGSLAGEGDMGERIKRGLAGAVTGAIVTKGLKSPKLGGTLYNIGKINYSPAATATTIPGSVVTKEVKKSKKEEDEEEKKKKTKYNLPPSAYMMKGRL